jgi:hypothetical protein
MCVCVCAYVCVCCKRRLANRIDLEMPSDIKGTQFPTQTRKVDTLIYNKEKYFIKFTNLTVSVVPCVKQWGACDMKIISAVHVYLEHITGIQLVNNIPIDINPKIS